MNKIIKFIKKEKTERAIKTFVEAFASYIAINIATADLSSVGALKGLIMGAIASAISILINTLNANDKITKDDYEDEEEL